MSSECRTRLRTGWLPWAVLGTSALLAPAFGWLGAVVTRRRYADAPPPCYGLGFGCDLSPTDYGWLTLILYLAAHLALVVVIAVLHLGRRRLALTRSIVAIAGVSLLWAIALVGTAYA